MFLLYGDLTRSVWYFVFSVASIRRHVIPTQSPFCQVSGFLIQYGTETSGSYSVRILLDAD